MSGAAIFAIACVFLNLPTITSEKRRREEVELWDAFHQDQPRILGGLLDAVVGGLRELPSVKLAELPRMADFAAFAEAVGRALGWEAGTVLSDYNANRQDATAAQVEDSVLASFLLEDGCAPGNVLNWHGTATEMLEHLRRRWVGRRHLGRLAKIAPGVYKRTPPHCPPTPEQWNIRCFRETGSKARRSSSRIWLGGRSSVLHKSF